MKILVGLSGGVDSSVAALILKQQGHEVIGATMSIWGRGGMAEKSGHKNACYGPDEKEDIEEARRIAEQIGIPYYVFDCVEEYERIVIDNFKSEYIKGNTPNPCIWCNSLVKFGVLPKLAHEHGIEFDKFATGHYARVENGVLKRGIAPNKDQSYFLYRLKPEQLENIILPLGAYTKDEIRKIAKENGLNVAEKPDSQDFYDGDYNELLGIEEKEGNIVDLSGKILGKHKGIWNYTIGQRKGIGISAEEPLYVLELRADTNEIVVGFKDKTMSDTLQASNLNWLQPMQANCSAKIRSTQQPTPVSVEETEDGVIKVVFENMQKSIASGQSIVMYDGDIVLGGGIIL
ncbi:MAG: tRNA 2-thiouridine(34) synthase MnmA [Candidatus Gastranaerophilales bacterium]|nr:tRNA 2-thiouridine(34) synthase MnmA [Candidatus Gastranaerophilales bacterium]MCM1073003.1 tRNA 2-thiouridine(34) synthase MnmA [Bacteroides sp.]